MTIKLPESLEESLLAEVRGGRFVSLDEAVAQAVRMLLDRKRDEPANADEEVPRTTARPIWETFAKIAESVSADEWAKLPVDGAEQHDHYLHGAPKRSVS